MTSSLLRQPPLAVKEHQSRVNVGPVVPPASDRKTFGSPIAGRRPRQIEHDARRGTSVRLLCRTDASAAAFLQT